MQTTAAPETSPVFITGANGFIGRALAERFAEDGREVRGVDRTADPTRGVVAGDTAEHGSWHEDLAGCGLVVHAAAVVSNAVAADAQWRTNVLGTRRVVAAAAAAGVGRFVHLSSIRAYGDLGYPDGVDESWPLRPDGHAYVDTKIASEHVVFQAHAAGEVAGTVVRPGDVYGPGSRPWTLIPLDETRRRRLVLPDGGRGVFSPVYIDDLVAGIHAAATVPAAAGHAINLVGPEPVSCAEFFGHYARMLGRGSLPTVPTVAAVVLATVAGRVERTLGRTSELNTETVRYLTRTGGYSRAKAERLLGWTPGVDLDEGMRRTEQWLRANGHLPAVAP